MRFSSKAGRSTMDRDGKDEIFVFGDKGSFLISVLRPCMIDSLIAKETCLYMYFGVNKGL